MFHYCVRVFLYRIRVAVHLCSLTCGCVRHCRPGMHWGIVVAVIVVAFTFLTAIWWRVAHESLALQTGWTALICAARHGHTDCARLLLDAGTDKNTKSWVRFHPLYLVE